MELALDHHELDFLSAAHELGSRQAELYPVVGAAIDADPYDFWMLGPGPEARGWFRRWRDRRRRARCEQGQTGDWSWWFHGLECDIHNRIDGRLVRIDFGPTTRRLTITGWSVLQFVMCAGPPWRSFERLRMHLADRGPPYDSLSGNHHRMSRICARLEALALFVPADPSLLKLRERFTAVRADNGFKEIDVPPELAPPRAMDLFVCERLVLADSAKKLIAERVCQTAAAQQRLGAGEALASFGIRS